MRHTTALACAAALALLAPALAGAGVQLGPTALDDKIIKVEHDLDVGHGATLHVVEKYSQQSLDRHPRRAVLMLTATVVTNQQWDSDVPDHPTFNSLDRAAREGFFAYSATYEGYPGSSQPPDGSVVTAERILAHMGFVLEWARHRSGAAQVDLVGSSLGSSIAAALGGVHGPVDPAHVGRIALTAHVYKNVTPVAQATILSPATCFQLQNAPDGYVDTPPFFYVPVLFNAEPQAQLWGYQTFPGRYATGPTAEGCDLPVFEAAPGRAPALLFWGDRDLVTPLSDLEQFCAEYGGPCSIAVIEGLGHAPNFEAIREEFWTQVWHFLG